MFEDLIAFEKLATRLTTLDMLKLKFIYLIRKSESEKPTWYLKLTDIQCDLILDSLEELFKT